MRHSRPSPSAVAFALLTLMDQAGAQEPWQFSLGIQGFAGGYQESVERRSIASAGLSFSADKADQGGLSLIYSSNWLDFYPPITDLHENSWFASGRKYQFTDKGSKFTFRLDGYWVDNDYEFDDTTKVWAAAPQVAFINASSTFYFDLGLAYSAYGNSPTAIEDLEVVQVSPTLGFGSSALTDWFQFRGYFIQPSNADRAQGKDRTSAVEFKYIHWFISKPLGLYSLQAGVLAGERVYAVDPDAAAIYNLADLQTGAVTVSGEWRWFETTSITTVVGHDWFENQLIGDEYARSFFYLGVTHTW